MCGFTKPRRTRAIRSEGVETTVTAPARGLTTTAHLAPTTATLSGSAGIGRRFSTWPLGSEIARSAFCVSAVTSATGLPPPWAEPPARATATTSTRSPRRRITLYLRAPSARRSDPELDSVLAARLRPGADLAVEHAPPPCFVRPRALVEPDLQPVELPPELLVAREPLGRQLAPPDRASHRAPRLSVV